MYKVLIYSLLLTLLNLSSWAEQGDFNSFIKPLFKNHCISCHGEIRPGKKTKIKGDIDLFSIKTEQDFLKHSNVMKEVMEAIDANEMPPEEKEPLSEGQKGKMLSSLKNYIRLSSMQKTAQKAQLYRLNRLQYNNTVRDLFKLNRNVFLLPEKLITRKSNYLPQALISGKVPKTVKVKNEFLETKKPLKGVLPFPQDSRASHGYDNQADNLSLSPLIIEKSLQLSVSIINSADFNEKNVGIWNELFAEPTNKNDLKGEVQKRLKKYLRRAFRTSIDKDTMDLYSKYFFRHYNHEKDFTSAMKKVVSASLSSPFFLYRYDDPKDKNEFNLASKLSYTLWSSMPDDELLNLAEQKQLRTHLQSTVQRMMVDPKIEGFLDTFPAQWTQLNGVLEAKPFRREHEFRYYHFNKNVTQKPKYQMVLEPLVHFDTIYLENRTIRDLIKPNFAYRSNFLQSWYEMSKPLSDNQQMVEDELEKNRQEYKILINKGKKISEPIRRKYESEIYKGQELINVKPILHWDFNGDLSEDSFNTELKPHGPVSFNNGHVVLNGSYLELDLPMDLHMYSIDIKFKLNGINQSGGLISLQSQMGGDNVQYDSLNYGKNKDGYWRHSLENELRHVNFSSKAKMMDDSMRLFINYERNGKIKLLKDGVLYSEASIKGARLYRKNNKLLIGIDQQNNEGEKLKISIDYLRIYNRTFNEKDLNQVSHGKVKYITRSEYVEKMTIKEKSLFIDNYKQVLVNTKKLKELIPTLSDRRIAKLRKQFGDTEFHRKPITDHRFGGMITNAALMTMTSTSLRSKPIARGAWMIETIFNDPPPPPPNNVPPLSDTKNDARMTIRERFALHRENKECAACHVKIDPLGFVLENYSPIGIWRDKYKNKREVDASGTLLRKYKFNDILDFKEAILSEEERFAKAFTTHLMRYTFSRKLKASDHLLAESIVKQSAQDGYRLRDLMVKVLLSKEFIN